MTIRVSLADDYPMVLAGLAAMLAADGRVEIVDQSLNGTEALAAILEKEPDIAVLDAVMPGMNGLEILQVVRDRGLSTRVVLLAGELGTEDLMESIRLGVNGILMKEEAGSVLLACIESLSSGARWVSIDLLERALNIAARRGSESDVMTPRENEVAERVAQGLQNKEIAERLGIADGTVRIHLHNIFRKLGIQNRVELSNRLRRPIQSGST